MLALADRYRSRGLRVVSATPIADDPDGAERRAITDAVRDEHMTYACYLDEHSSWARATGLSVRPSFMVVDRAGRVAFRTAAVLSDGAPELQQLSAAIETALATAR